MAETRNETKAINLRIERDYERLVRDTIAKVRKGGPGFRSALRALVDDDTRTEYVPAREVHSRFAELERKLFTEVSDGEEYVPADVLEQRFKELETRLQALERSAPAVQSDGGG